MLYRCDDVWSLEDHGGCRRINARDPTPALGLSLDIVNEILERDYGVRLGGALLLDPLGVSGDAVFYGGRKLGVIHYDPLRISLTPWGARVITRKWRNPKGYVIVRRSAEEYIRKGYNVMAGGVKEADPVKSWVIVLNEDLEPIAVGRRRGDRVAVMTRGVVNEFGALPPERSREYVLEYNAESIERRAKIARDRIVKGVKGRAFVLYSGGKDSEVTLRLSEVISAKPVYIDTGLEFPEAREHALKVVEKYDGYVLSLKNPNAFREAMRQLGFPGMDFRRCTQLLKIAPARGFFSKDDTLIVGLRAAESSSRRREPVFGRNRSLGLKQVNPIIDRISLDVFLYAWYDNVELNPLYYRGLRRLGCRLCPASKDYDIIFLKRYYPSLYRRLRELVKEYAEDKRPEGRRYYFKSGRKPLRRLELKFEGIPRKRRKRDWAIMIDTCVACGACERVCPKNAIVVKNRVEINRDECDNCGKCLDVCPMVRAYKKIFRMMG